MEEKIRELFADVKNRPTSNKEDIVQKAKSFSSIVKEWIDSGVDPFVLEQLEFMFYVNLAENYFNINIKYDISNDEEKFALLVDSKDLCEKVWSFFEEFDFMTVSLPEYGYIDLDTYNDLIKNNKPAEEAQKSSYFWGFECKPKLRF